MPSISLTCADTQCSTPAALAKPLHLARRSPHALRASDTHAVSCKCLPHAICAYFLKVWRRLALAISRLGLGNALRRTMHCMRDSQGVSSRTVPMELGAFVPAERGKEQGEGGEKG
jgi:hypothetical protein